MAGRILALVLAVLAVAGAPDGANAQASPETAAQLQALDEQLKSDNRFVRLAALEAALASENVMIRRMAFDAAFGGNDMEMKAYALRQFFQPEFIYPLELLPNDTKQSRQRAEELTGIQLRVGEYDRESGQIAAQVLGWFHGTVALDELAVKRGRCALTLKVADARYMQGPLRCEGKEPMPVRLRLN